jgi:hypothetical protein
MVIAPRIKSHQPFDDSSVPTSASALFASTTILTEKIAALEARPKKFRL